MVLSLAARELTPAGGKQVIWHRPRFEAAGKPTLLLSDYATFGPAYEIDYPSVFASSARTPMARTISPIQWWFASDSLISFNCL